MGQRELAVDLPRERLAELCRRYHVRRLAVFGSVLGDGFDEGSDIDMLVEFDAGRAPGLAFFDLESDLSRAVGRTVDLSTPGFLSGYIRDRIRDEAVELYAST